MNLKTLTTMDIIVNNFTIGNYSEATSDNDAHLSLLHTEDGSVYNLLFPACRCKDFFNDLFLKIHTGKTMSIYSFDTNKIDIEPVKDSEYFFLLIVPRTVNLNTDGIVGLLDYFRPKSYVYNTTVNDKTSAVIKFHRNWTDRPYLLSLFINLCRIGTLYNGENFNDFVEYLKKNSLNISKEGEVSFQCLKQFINSIPLYEDYLNGIVHEQSYDTELGDYRFHNETGSISFLSKLKGIAVCEDEEYEEECDF